MERDEESGFNYHGARYYVPWLGRWLNCDPIGAAGGTNMYVYSNGNPVRFVDQSGMDPDPATGFPKDADNPGYIDAGTEEVIEVSGTAPSITHATPTVVIPGDSTYSDSYNEQVPMGLGAILRYHALGPDQAFMRGLMANGYGCAACHITTAVWNTLGAGAINPANSLPYDWAIDQDGYNSWKRLSMLTRVAVEMGTELGAFHQSLNEPANFGPPVKTRGSALGKIQQDNSVTLPGGSGEAYAGHGTFRPRSGDTTIPDGRTLIIPRDNMKLSDAAGRILERGDWPVVAALRQLPQDELSTLGKRVLEDFEGIRVLGPGSPVENYTLDWPKDLTVMENSGLVPAPTKLETLLQIGNGRLVWAACTQ